MSKEEKAQQKRRCYLCRERGHMAYSCPLGNNSKPISIDANIMLRKDGNGTSFVTIAKHPAIHTKALPKYVAPNLRGPNLVWVPSKRGWMCLGTKGIGGLIQIKFIFLILWLNQGIEAFCIYTTQCQIKTMKSKCYKHTSIFFELWEIYWKYLMACKFIWVESRLWTKIILQVEKWATCHWLLKYDLKTNTYGIWFIYALLVLIFWIFEPFMSFHDFTRFIFEFLLKLAHMSLLKVFMQYLRFLDFYMSNDPKSELELRKLAKFWTVWNLVLRTVHG